MSWLNDSPRATTTRTPTNATIRMIGHEHADDRDGSWQASQPTLQEVRSR